MLNLIEGKKPPGIFSLLDDMGATVRNRNEVISSFTLFLFFFKAHAMESHAVDAKALEKLKG